MYKITLETLKETLSILKQYEKDISITELTVKNVKKLRRIRRLKEKIADYVINKPD